MPELKNFAGSVAVVVSSCDPFFDAWRPFAQFFRKYWGDCPFPIFLNINQLQVRSSWIRPLRTGPDPTWGRNVILALRQISQSHILYLQEDYFLTSRVDEDLMAQDLKYAFDHDVDSFSFRARSERELAFQFLNERFGLVPRDSDGRTRCQATLWKRDALLSILREEESVWDFEAHGSERTREMQILSYGVRDGVPINYTMSAIVRGLWTREALTMCGEAGVAIDPHFRRTYTAQPWLRRWRRARTRQALRRELTKYRSRTIDLDRNAAPQS